MKRRFFLSLAALPLLAACGGAVQMAPALTQAALTGLAAREQQMNFSSVTVNVNRASYDSFVAQNYAGRLAADLKAAIESELGNRRSSNGVPLVIDISRLGVAAVATTTLGQGQSALEGTATVRQGSNVLARHEIAAALDGRAMIAGAVLGGGTSALGNDGTYQRLVSEFAEATVEKLTGGGNMGAAILGGMVNR